VRNIFYSYAPSEDNTFESRQIDRFSLDSNWADRRNAKIYKILPHLFADSEYSIWIDDNINLPDHPQEMITQCLQKHDLAVFGISCCKTINDQLDKIKKLKKESSKLIDAQVASYREEGCPLDQAAGGIILRHHTPEIARFNLSWWEQICKWSSRDQLSFPYVAWKLNLKYETIPGSIYECKGLR